MSNNRYAYTLNNLVNKIIDRGITRIARTRLVEEFIQELVAYGNSLPMTDEYKVDTVACQIKIDFIKAQNFTIILTGDDTVGEPVTIQLIDGAFKLHGFPVATNTMNVLITSLLLRNTNEEVTVTISNNPNNNPEV